MNSLNYIKDCVEKAGDGKDLILTSQQSTVMKGMIAGSIETGKVLAMIKKDIFQYSKMKIEGSSSVCEEVSPLRIYKDTHVALRAILGINGEMADITETFYSYIQGDKSLDVGKVLEDLGDMSFYMSLLLNLIGSDWEEIQNLNLEKTEKLSLSSSNDITYQCPDKKL